MMERSVNTLGMSGKPTPPPQEHGPHEKATKLFSLFNPTQGMVSRRSFAQTLAEYGFHLDQMAVDAVFDDGDLDTDGFLSQNELVSLLSTQYTTLLDILYYRWRDGAELERLRLEANRLHGVLDEKHRDMMELRNLATNQEVELEEKRVAIARQEAHADIADSNSKKTVNVYDAQQQKVGFAAERLDESAADLAASQSLHQYRQEEESAWRQREDEWTRALTELEDDVKNAVAEEDRLRKEYEAARERTAQKKAMLEEGKNHRVSCVESHEESMQQLEDAVARVEGMLTALRNREEEWRMETDNLHQAERVMVDAQKALDEERQHLAKLRGDFEELEHGLSRTKDQLQYASEEVERHKEHQRQIHQTYDRFVAQRAAKVDQEDHLIHEEMKLREERRRLQLKEVNLRGTAASMYSESY